MANAYKKVVGLRKVYWNFFNNGRRFQFDSNKRTVDIKNNPTTMGEVHRELVRNANKPSVFLLNELGESIS